jgi:hypothetical protein
MLGTGGDCPPVLPGQNHAEEDNTYFEKEKESRKQQQQRSVGRQSQHHCNARQPSRRVLSAVETNYDKRSCPSCAFKKMNTMQHNTGVDFSFRLCVK